jgi:hypothetical protein
VDDRLNGDGAGIALGVNEPILGWVIGGVATAIWIAYFIAQKDFGDFEDKVGTRLLAAAAACDDGVDYAAGLRVWRSAADAQRCQGNSSA